MDKLGKNLDSALTLKHLHVIVFKNNMFGNAQH